MKTNLIPAIKLTLICIVFFVVLYTVFIWGIGQFIAPNHGKGEIISYTSPSGVPKYGFINIGQSFTADKYFWSRPSAVGYNASGSGASNKGTSNKEYLEQVQARVDTFLLHNPEVNIKDLPVEMVTASGSGLDPHLSPKSAFIQVARIAKSRNIPENRIRAMVKNNIESPLFGIFGPARLNVLKLNIELDKMKTGH